ncbi:MAG: hypothetical protein WB764_02815 [Xanthobacteraceae bacterium]
MLLRTTSTYAQGYPSAGGTCPTPGIFTQSSVTNASGYQDFMFCGSGGTWNSPVIVLTTTGDVGIGTTNPTALIQVVSTASPDNTNPPGPGNVVSDFTDNGSNLLMSHNYYAAVGIDQWQFGVTPNAAVSTTSASIGVGYIYAQPALNLVNVGVYFETAGAFFKQSSSGVSFSTGGTPGAAFQLQQGAGTGTNVNWRSDTGFKIEGQYGSPNIFVSGDGLGTTALAETASSKAFVVEGAASQTADLQEWQNSSGLALSVVTSSGAVGIGTTSPEATLDVNGYIRLAKNSSRPVACSSTYDGSIALTALYTLCVCKGGSNKLGERQ